MNIPLQLMPKLNNNDHILYECRIAIEQRQKYNIKQLLTDTI